MRAISVKVNEVVGVAGFVVPGTRVDVMVTLSGKNRDEDSMTRVVVSNAQVLTAGTRYDQEKAKDGAPIPSTVVTLLVTPDDGERVALAASEGQIMLTLRNPLDQDADRDRRRADRRLCSDSRRRRRKTPAVRAAPHAAATRRRAVPRPAPTVYTVEAFEAPSDLRRLFDEHVDSCADRAPRDRGAMAAARCSAGAVPASDVGPAGAAPPRRRPRRRPAVAPARPQFERVVVTAGRSTVVATDFDVTRIAVTNPEVADAVVVQPREVLVDGKKAGTVSLIVWASDQRKQYDIVVEPAITDARAAAAGAVPGRRHRGQRQRRSDRAVGAACRART